MKDKVVEWLESLDSITVVKPVTLTIGKQTWEGASYTQRGVRRYYLVGELPASYPRNRKVCYQFEGDDRDWYIAGYLDDFTVLREFQKPFHPFGNHWMLKSWDSPERIDAGQTPYKRMKVSHET